MDEFTALERSIALCQKAIDTTPIDDADLARPTPCAAFTVADLLDHIVDTHNLLLAAAGGDMPDANGTASDRHHAAGAAAVSAWRARGVDGTIDVGGNELPASFGLSLHLLEAYLHAWDLAAALGRTFAPDDELTDTVNSAAQVVISDGMRGDAEGMPYAAAIDLGSGTPMDRLVAFTGRDPGRWAVVTT